MALISQATRATTKDPPRFNDGCLSAAEFEAEAQAWVQWCWPPDPHSPSEWAPEWVWMPPRSKSISNAYGASIRLRTGPGYLSLKRPLPRWNYKVGSDTSGDGCRKYDYENVSIEGGGDLDGALEEIDVAIADEHTLVPQSRCSKTYASTDLSTFSRAEVIAACSQEWFVDVTYSPTWRVPVLYFTARRHCSRGRSCSQAPLSWAEIALHLPQSLREDLLNECSGSEDISESKVGSVGNEVGMWPLLTEELHPVTGLPCFMLHPCTTAARMTCLLSAQRDSFAAVSPPSRGDGIYLLTWLTVFGPVVGLTVSPSFYCKKDPPHE